MLGAKWITSQAGNRAGVNELRENHGNPGFSTGLDQASYVWQHLAALGDFQRRSLVKKSVLHVDHQQGTRISLDPVRLFNLIQLG